MESDQQSVVLQPSENTEKMSLLKHFLTWLSLRLGTSAISAGGPAALRWWCPGASPSRRPMCPICEDCCQCPIVENFCLFPICEDCFQCPICEDCYQCPICEDCCQCPICEDCCLWPISEDCCQCPKSEHCSKCPISEDFKPHSKSSLKGTKVVLQVGLVELILAWITKV